MMMWIPIVNRVLVYYYQRNNLISRTVTHTYIYKINMGGNDGCCVIAAVVGEDDDAWSGDGFFIIIHHGGRWLGDKVSGLWGCCFFMIEGGGSGGDEEEMSGWQQW